jgi:hypothetical protein
LIVVVQLGVCSFTPTDRIIGDYIFGISFICTNPKPGSDLCHLELQNDQQCFSLGVNDIFGSFPILICRNYGRWVDIQSKQQSQHRSETASIDVGIGVDETSPTTVCRASPSAWHERWRHGTDVTPDSFLFGDTMHPLAI